MSIHQSGIQQQFNELASTEVVSTSVNLEASFVVGTDVIPIFTVLGQRIMRNFIDSFAEVNMLSVQVPASLYADTIVPNSNNLKVRLTRKTNESTGRESDAPGTGVILYNAMLSDVSDPYANATGNGDSSQAVNSLQLVDLHIQLIRPYIDDLRVAEVGGSFPDSRVGDVMGYKLCPDNTGVSDTALNSGTFEGIRGLDIDPPTNQSAYRNLEIPVGTRLTKVPRYLQDRYGVYATGMGRFVDNGIWYVYPLADFTRFNRKKKTLTIVNIPASQANGLDQSYLYKAEQLTVFATGRSNQFDNSDQVQQTSGNIVNFTKASSLSTGMVRNDKNKAIPVLSETNKSFSVADRPKGDNKAVTTSGRFTDNPYKDASEQSMGLGSLMTFNWENSQPSLLYPGMPVKVQYSKGDDVQVKMGTLFSTETSISPSTSQFTDNDYRSVTKLFVFVERNKA